jgi:hypothetical protein
MATTNMAPSMTAPTTASQTNRVPVTLDDLRSMEDAMFQNPTARFSTTQRVFFEALLSHPTLDVAAAAKICDVPIKKAMSWIAQPTVQAALNHLMTTRMKRLGLDKDSLLAKIVDLLDMSTGVVPIIKSGYDKDTKTFTSQSVKETDLGAAARFTDQLSKHFQLYAPEGVSGLSVNLSLVMGEDPQLIPQSSEDEVVSLDALPTIELDPDTEEDAD